MEMGWGRMQRGMFGNGGEVEWAGSGGGWKGGNYLAYAPLLYQLYSTQRFRSKYSLRRFKIYFLIFHF